jgi:pimeloyl-ACP methyl ester carboxylesterase
VQTFTSFDGLHIAYHDEGQGPTVMLLHGFGVDALGQFGDFERIRPRLEKRQQMFREVFGGALPLPNPPAEGRPGLAHALRAAGARTILPDMRGFGDSDKPRETLPLECGLCGRHDLKIGNQVCGTIDLEQSFVRESD